MKQGWPFFFITIHFSKWIYLLRNVNFSSEFPIVNGDYFQYYGRVLSAHKLLAESGRLWGYDPFQMAGFIAGPFHEVGTWWLSFITYALSGVLPVSRSLLGLEIAGLVLAPLLLLPTVRNFGGTKGQSWLAFGIAAIFLEVFEFFSRGNLAIGLLGYRVAVFGGLLQVSLFWRWTQRQDIRSWVSFTLVSAVVFIIHPAVLILVLPALALIWAFSIRALALRGHLLLALAASLVVLANFFWIHPYLHFSWWHTSAPYFLSAGWRGLAYFLNPLKPTYGGSVYVLSCLCFIAGLALAYRRRAPGVPGRRVVLFSAWSLILAGLIFFGDSIPFLSKFQLGRLIQPLWMVLCIGFVLSLDAWDGWTEKSFKPAIIFTTCLVLLATHQLVHWKLPLLTTRLPAGQKEFLEFLREKPDLEGRLLLETSDSDEPRAGDYIPSGIGQPVIGGPHPGSFVRSRFTLFKGFFSDGRKFSQQPVLFERPLQDYSAADLAEYLDLYNVTRVASHYRLSVKILNSFDELLEPLERAGYYHVYRVKRKPSWFFEGQGDLSFSYDRLAIQEASAGKIILKFHWIDTFQSEPDLPLRPVFLKDDPVPFIEIDNAAGVKNIVIFNPGV